MKCYILTWNPGRFGNQMILLLNLLAYSLSRPHDLFLIFDMPRDDSTTARSLFPSGIINGKIYSYNFSSLLNRVVLFLFPGSWVNKMRLSVSHLIHYLSTALPFTYSVASDYDSRYHQLTSSLVFKDPFFLLTKLSQLPNASLSIVCLWGYKYRAWHLVDLYKQSIISEVLSSSALCKYNKLTSTVSPALFLHIRGTDFYDGLPFTRVSPESILEICTTVFEENPKLQHIIISSDDALLASELLNVLQKNMYSVTLSPGTSGVFRVEQFYHELSSCCCVVGNCSSLSFSAALLFSKPYYYIANGKLCKVTSLDMAKHPLLGLMC